MGGNVMHERAWGSRAETQTAQAAIHRPCQEVPGGADHIHAQSRPLPPGQTAMVAEGYSVWSSKPPLASAAAQDSP